MLQKHHSHITTVSQVELSVVKLYFILLICSIYAVHSSCSYLYTETSHSTSHLKFVQLVIMSPFHKIMSSYYALGCVHTNHTNFLDNSNFKKLNSYVYLHQPADAWLKCLHIFAADLNAHIHNIYSRCSFVL